MRLIITLEKARKVDPRQMGLFGRKPEMPKPKPAKGKPPGAGWQPIPKGTKGGFRRRKGSRWEYWYPETGMTLASKETVEPIQWSSGARPSLTGESDYTVMIRDPENDPERSSRKDRQARRQRFEANGYVWEVKGYEAPDQVVLEAKQKRKGKSGNRWEAIEPGTLEHKQSINALVDDIVPGSHARTTHGDEPPGAERTEEVKQLLNIHRNNSFSVDEKSRADYQDLLGKGWVEIVKHDTYSFNIVRLTDAGRQAVEDHYRAQVQRAADKGKIEEKDVEPNLERLAILDKLEQVRSMGHGSRQAHERWKEVADPLYARLTQIEKDAGWLPTTAEGLREHAGIPKEWIVHERFGRKDKARTAFYDDYRVDFRWSGGKWLARRYYKMYTQGGYWKEVGKEKPFKQLLKKIRREEP